MFMGLVKHYLEIDPALKPDISLESPPRGGLSRDPGRGHAHVEGKAVYLHLHDGKFFAGKLIFHGVKILDGAQDGIVVALHAVRL